MSLWRDRPRAVFEWRTRGALAQAHMAPDALGSCDVSACCASIITTACSASWEHINTHEWTSTCTSRKGCVCVCVFECDGCVPDL